MSSWFGNNKYICIRKHETFAYADETHTMSKE